MELTDDEKQALTIQSILDRISVLEKQMVGVGASFESLIVILESAGK